MNRNNKIGSPDARKIVALLCRRQRRATQDLRRAQRDHYPADMTQCYAAAAAEIHNAAELSRRTLYGTPL